MDILTTMQQFQVHNKINKRLQIYLFNWYVYLSILSVERGLTKQCLPTINDYLAAQKRQVIKIKQDGNCFYAALSFQLFGTQDKDLAVRNVVYIYTEWCH